MLHSTRASEVILNEYLTDHPHRAHAKLTDQHIRAAQLAAAYSEDDLRTAVVMAAHYRRKKNKRPTPRLAT
jgi:hypothetical protein